MGLLYFIGTLESQNANVEQLWPADGTGIQILRWAISGFCFNFACICFDNRDIRAEKRKSDKLAVTWNSLVQNYLKS